MKPQSEWVVKMHARGWSAARVAKRWGMCKRNLYYIVDSVHKTPGWLEDAVAGLPERNDIDPATGKPWKGEK